MIFEANVALDVSRPKQVPKVHERDAFSATGEICLVRCSAHGFSGRAAWSSGPLPSVFSHRLVRVSAFFAERAVNPTPSRCCFREADLVLPFYTTAFYARVCVHKPCTRVPCRRTKTAKVHGCAGARPELREQRGRRPTGKHSPETSRSKLNEGDL